MNKEELINLVNDNIVKLDNNAFDMLERLMNITLETNEKFNLTAIKDEEKFRELMIYDSLLPLKYVNLDNKTVLDVGTGAGFPGLPLTISTKGNITLLDSTNKKIGHICGVIEDFGLKNANAICARAEEYASKNREQYDYVIARAVAPLNVLAELCLPMVKVGGTFIAMKGNNGPDELFLAKNAIDKLGGEVLDIHFDELPLSKEGRTTILIKKIKPTSKKYPRRYSEIMNNTL